MFSALVNPMSIPMSTRTSCPMIGRQAALFLDWKTCSHRCRPANPANHPAMPSSKTWVSVAGGRSGLAVKPDRTVSQCNTLGLTTYANKETCRNLLSLGENRCPNTPPMGIKKSKTKKAALQPVETCSLTVAMSYRINGTILEEESRGRAEAVLHVVEKRRARACLVLIGREDLQLAQETCRCEMKCGGKEE